jgi:type II secretory pathway component PulF
MEWPFISKFAAVMSQDVTASIPYITVFTVIFVIVAIYSMPRYTGFFRKYLDMIPPWNIYRSMQSASFLLTISSFLEAGLNIEVAIPEIMDISSPWLKSHLDKMLINIRQTVPPGEALNTGLISTEQAAILQAYGKVTSFSVGIQRAAKEVVEKTLSQVSIASNTLRVGGMLLVGVSMIIFIFGFYSLISSMNLGG